MKKSIVIGTANPSMEEINAATAQIRQQLLEEAGDFKHNAIKWTPEVGGETFVLTGELVDEVVPPGVKQ